MLCRMQGYLDSIMEYLDLGITGFYILPFAQMTIYVFFGICKLGCGKSGKISRRIYFRNPEDGNGQHALE